jgi:hypothetical protein
MWAARARNTMPLQTYKRYTVDYRLRQFRLCPADYGVIQFIDFDTEEGDALLSEMLEQNLIPEDKYQYLV